MPSDLLMLHGKDVRLSTLEDRREQLRALVPSLPDTIRYSETFNVPLSEMTQAVRKHQLEGIIAKRLGSPYRSGERSADWLKMARQPWPGVRNRRLHTKWRLT
jgi:bifunctional non-homologous end joining protein LigD